MSWNISVRRPILFSASACASAARCTVKRGMTVSRSEPDLKVFVDEARQRKCIWPGMRECINTMMCLLSKRWENYRPRYPKMNNTGWCLQEGCSAGRVIQEYFPVCVVVVFTPKAPARYHLFRARPCVRRMAGKGVFRIFDTRLL